MRATQVAVTPEKRATPLRPMIRAGVLILVVELRTLVRDRRVFRGGSPAIHEPVVVLEDVEVVTITAEDGTVALVEDGTSFPVQLALVDRDETLPGDFRHAGVRFIGFPNPTVEQRQTFVIRMMKTLTSATLNHPLPARLTPPPHVLGGFSSCSVLGDWLVTEFAVAVRTGWFRLIATRRIDCSSIHRGHHARLRAAGSAVPRRERATPRATTNDARVRRREARPSE